VIHIPAVRASPAALGWALAAALLIALLSAVAPLYRLLRTDIAVMIARR
jgi:ABC-type antimicrobial peptide transport system permease subunit